MVCAGPVKYIGDEALRRDIDNLKAAMTATGAKAAFMAHGAIGDGKRTLARLEYSLVPPLGRHRRMNAAFAPVAVIAAFRLSMSRPQRFVADVLHRSGADHGYDWRNGAPVMARAKYSW